MNLFNWVNIEITCMFYKIQFKIISFLVNCFSLFTITIDCLVTRISLHNDVFWSIDCEQSDKIYIKTWKVFMKFHYFTRTEMKLHIIYFMGLKLEMHNAQYSCCKKYVANNGSQMSLWHYFIKYITLLN